MTKNLEVIFDNVPSGGCGCNCGCNGSTEIEEMNSLVEQLKEYKFEKDLKVNVLPISTIESTELINRINKLLERTNASFRADKNNVEQLLSELLPLVVLDDSIITAYGVPTFNEVVMGVNKSI